MCDLVPRCAFTSPFVVNALRYSSASDKYLSAISNMSLYCLLLDTS